VCSNNKTNNHFNELIAYEIVKVIIVYAAPSDVYVVHVKEKPSTKKAKKKFLKKLIES
jgi:hypothetical protein